jgi:hypothetical protein
MTVTMHTCRGNFKSSWVASGGYEPVAEAMFSSAVDAFFMEFDSERAGGFEPLRYLPKGKKVVLGLVTTKVGELESKDELIRKIKAAEQFVSLENLCISPQCGFSSTHHGNGLSADEQWRKLERVVDVAGRETLDQRGRSGTIGAAARLDCLIRDGLDQAERPPHTQRRESSHVPTPVVPVIAGACALELRRDVLGTASGAAVRGHLRRVPARGGQPRQEARG